MLLPSLPDASCRRFSLSDIKSATNNFSDNQIIGNGSFGNVYRAKIITETGSPIEVAIKRRNSKSSQGSEEFWTEVNLLSSFRHTHIISLIGCCDDSDANEMVLVYEHMANGTLSDHIYKKTGNWTRLSWEQRLKICIGVARGLEYLHTGTGINQIVIHRDIKSSNILLDENMEPRISDFGLCKKCSGNLPDAPIIASVKGTRGYLDPHYRETHELSTKTDVYAFGVVLLEVYCGKQASDYVAVGGRQKRLVSWAPQCIREGVAHRIIDRDLRGRITQEGSRYFHEITLQCLQERPNDRPTMVEVVAKLEAALRSQTATPSSFSDDNDYINIQFAQVTNPSSLATSDADSHRRTFETGSGKSDPGPGSNTYTTTGKRLQKSGSSVKYNGLEIIAYLNSDHATETFNNSLSECSKLAKKVNQPSVVVDNESCKNATIIQVINTSTLGVLLELLQVLTDFNLKVIKSRRDNDGPWFMDVFCVTDHDGNKVTNEVKIQNIKEALCVYSSSTSPMGRKCNERPIPDGHTTIELIGNDRPGLISELSAILSDLQCNVVTAEIWTHNTRLAAVMHVSDKETKSAIIEQEKVSKIKKLLLVVLNGGHGYDNREAMITISDGCTWIDRKLHQIMFADKYFDFGPTIKRHKVEVKILDERNYSAIEIWCKHTPKVLFDAVCTLTELGYFIFHFNFTADGAESFKMEFWIRHTDGSPFESDAERQKVIKFLEAAIERRVSPGLKIEIRTKDRVGLLNDVTRIMREHSLNITRAKVATTGDKAVFSFYLADNLGYAVDPKIINNVRNEIGKNILQVKGNHKDSYQVVEESSTRSSILKSFLSNWMRYISNYTFNK